MKLSWHRELVQLIPIVAMFAAAVACWSYVPERIAVHWNLRGEADGFAGKAVGLLLLPAIGSGVYALLLVLPRFDPGRANYENFAGVYYLIRFCIASYLAALYGVMLLMALGYRVDMDAVVGVALGALFIVLGNFTGKIRPNWFVGVRTPWTLSSKLSWTKTHRLAGWLFILMGVLAIVWGLVQTPWMFGAMLAIDVTCPLLLVVFSYVVYRHDPQRGGPAGTSPAAD